MSRKTSSPKPHYRLKPAYRRASEAPSHVPSDTPDTRIDKFTFFGVLFILLGVTLPLIFFPSQGADWVAQTKMFVTDKFGFAYLGFGAMAVIFVIYILCSDIGNIKLGRPEEEIEFKTGSWAAMMFCGGIGASILYWGILEWAYYYQGPPFGIEPKSPEAVRWASTYGIFHWGPVAWAIYLVPAIGIAYFSHVRNSPVLKVSYSLMPLFGEKLTRSNWGKLVDVFFVFGMIGGGATTLGLASPMITEGLHDLLGAPNSLAMQLAVLLITTAIFAYSAFKGMKAGIQKLSNINFYLSVGFVIFVLLVGPTTFILNTGLEAIGRSLSHMVTMMTWTEAFGQFEEHGFKQTNFPKDWTVFYWAWWLVFAPTIGLFIAKISRGRTIRQMTAGSMFFGSLGCAVFFIVLGNYAMYLQLTGALDVVSVLNSQSPNAAIFAVLNTLPMAKIVIAAFVILAVLFTATTFDSISYILASVVQHEVDGEPHRWNRLFWAFTLCFMPAALMFLGGLSTLQTASIFAGAPLLIIMSLMMASIIKAAKYDLHYQPDYSLRTIHIEELPDNAPWEHGETSEAPEGSVLAQMAVYEEQRQQQQETQKGQGENK
ncbi:BCCT family transporter [Bergeriella denitrificans]|uniref:Transmembrane transport protein BCCT family n=1 Tax=Bergeriella denitrificans TaxID=494 RepID=A0A378UHR0_BERDE|nr:BCCT family transporter [Bergeriella denitrificans]STZ76031.1 transmembrane transport protein BCCT family [Bergeriella denitrificans]